MARSSPRATRKPLPSRQMPRENVARERAETERSLERDASERAEAERSLERDARERAERACERAEAKLRQLGIDPALLK